MIASYIGIYIDKLFQEKLQWIMVKLHFCLICVIKTLKKNDTMANNYLRIVYVVKIISSTIKAKLSLRLF